MKVIINCDPDIYNPENTVFEYLKEKLKESLRNFKIEIEDTELKYEQ